MINLNTNNGNQSLLQQLQQKQQSIFEKLASGKRVNSAADDAAGLQIIDRLSSQTSGYKQAVNNAYDGISLSQVADGGLSGISGDVSKIRQLTVQAGNGILSASDRQALQKQVGQLQDNIKQTITQTNFAGKPLLSSDGSIDFQVGANAGQKLSAGTKDVAKGIQDVLNVDVTDPSKLDSALKAADSAVDYVGSARADIGATQNQFESVARNLTQTQVNVSAAQSRIQDTDYAQAASEQAVNNIQNQASIAVQKQSNQQQGQVLALLGG